jgi:hypothetical protein
VAEKYHRQPKTTAADHAQRKKLRAMKIDILKESKYGAIYLIVGENRQTFLVRSVAVAADDVADVLDIHPSFCEWDVVDATKPSDPDNHSKREKKS